MGEIEGIDAGWIDPMWLEAIRGGTLFYPAAGDDTRAFIEFFSPSLTKYHFNDLFYTTERDQRSPVPSDYTRVQKKMHPSMSVRDQDYERINIGRTKYRRIQSSTLVEKFSGPFGDIEVTRRKGFGQYALMEFAPRSISVFVHRRDSQGEGGSNMWFLANREASHPPLSNLWDSLAPRLTDKALVVTDGSLSTFKFLWEAQRRDPRLLYSEGIAHIHGGFVWQCVGCMHDYPSAIWGLERCSPA